MDAIREYIIQQIHSRIGHMGVWSLPVGDILVRAAAIFRDDTRGSGKVPEGGKRVVVS